MSQSALDIYAQHKKYQVEDGTFSETALFNGVDDLKGIFDESYATGSKDAGNVNQQFKKPRFLVDVVPAGVIPNTTELQVNGVDYIITKVSGTDERGPQVLWLRKK
jgi:hypothetical protein